MEYIIRGPIIDRFPGYYLAEVGRIQAYVPLLFAMLVKLLLVNNNKAIDLQCGMVNWLDDAHSLHLY